MNSKKLRCQYCRKEFRTAQGRKQHIKKRRGKYDEREAQALERFPRLIHR